MNPKHSAKTAEHYTPSDIVDRVRRVFGGQIDTDPCSCAKANETVQAVTYYDKDQDGRVRQWSGNVFVNPPGGKTNNTPNPVYWWQQTINRYSRALFGKRPESAIFLAYSIEFLQSVQLHVSATDLPFRFPICYPKRRIKFIGMDGQAGLSPTHASCLIYLGPEPARFADEFETLGAVVLP